MNSAVADKSISAVPRLAVPSDLQIAALPGGPWWFPIQHGLDIGLLLDYFRRRGNRPIVGRGCRGSYTGGHVPSGPGGECLSVRPVTAQGCRRCESPHQMDGIV